ncbi:MAG: response regulator transcription factor [Chloroflexi bacterium]|nr:response regulator transcription factor [Chloroflexota bacterium]
MASIGVSRRRPSILIADGDIPMTTAFARALQAQGYDVRTCRDASGALRAMNDSRPGLLLLATEPPDMDGLQLCQKARETHQVPMIVISESSSDEDKLRAFELGADDYVSKPFNFDELCARIRAVLRRSAQVTFGNGLETFRLADIEIHLSARQVLQGGREVKTTPIEFELLRVLASNAGKVLTYQTLLARVWGPEYRDEREYLRVYMNHLRHKIEPDPAQPRYIQTVPRVGYRLACIPELCPWLGKLCQLPRNQDRPRKVVQAFTPRLFS